MTYDIAFRDDSHTIVAIVPHGGDIESAIAHYCAQTGEPRNVLDLHIAKGVTLVEDLDDVPPDRLVWWGEPICIDNIMYEGEIK